MADPTRPRTQRRTPPSLPHHRIRAVLPEMSLRRAWLAVAALALVVGLVLPFLMGARAQAASQNQATWQPSRNCVPVSGMRPPLAWAWKDEPNPRLFFSPGESLEVQLTSKAADSGTGNPAAPVVPPPTVQVCAVWSPSPLVQGGSRDGQPLSLGVLSQGESLTQLRVQLDARFPARVRMPVWIKLIPTPLSSGSLPPLARRVELSSRWLCVFISTLFLGLVYFLLAMAVHYFYGHADRKPISLKTHGLRVLNPAVISAGDYGTASLGNLQILWFTMIVTWIMADAWLMTGKLLNPSPDILALLGISGTINVLASSLTLGQQRISLDNWNWLVERRYLRREDEIDPVRVAKWGDLVMDRGVLNPSRYQVIIFGFLIGVKLLVDDLDAINTFAVPGFFLGLQSVSGSIYLFGKAVSPTTKQELENYVDILRQKGAITLTSEEESYLERTIKSLFGAAALGTGFQPSSLPIPPGPPTPPSPPSQPSPPQPNPQGP